MADSPALAGIEFKLLPLSSIAPDPNQVRKEFDEDFIAGLADTIRSKGVIAPITVRPTQPSDQVDTAYVIVAGENRWRASGIAGKATIPAAVRADLTLGDIVVLQVLENLQRKDLSLAETCDGVTRLVQAVGFADACKQLGKSEAWVSRHSTFGELPAPIIQLVRERKLDSIDVAKDLAALTQLRPERVIGLVGRYNGTHNSALREASDWERERFPSLYVPPTREEVRNELKEARAEKEAKEEKAQQKALAKSDPTVKARVAAEREAKKKEEEARKKKRDKFKAIKEAAESIEDRYNTSIAAALGLKASKRQAYGYDHRAPMWIESEYLNEHNQKLPKEATGLRYDVSVSDCSAEHVRKFSNACELPGMVSANATLRLQLSLPDDLKAAEALQIQALLGKRLRIRISLQVRGDGLPSLLEHLQQRELPLAPAKGSDKAAGESAGVDVVTGINRFLSQKTRHKHGARIKASDFHNAYRTWCLATKGITEIAPLTSNEWGAALEQHGVKKMRSNGIVYQDIEVIA